MSGTSTSLNFVIEGMHCDGCVRRVTQVLARCGQGEVEAVSIGNARVAAANYAAPTLLAALQKAGFSARVLDH